MPTSLQKALCNAHEDTSQFSGIFGYTSKNIRCFTQVSLVVPLFDSNGDKHVTREEFSAKSLLLLKMVFDGLDKNQDGGTAIVIFLFLRDKPQLKQIMDDILQYIMQDCAGLQISEVSLESLLRPPFLRSLSRTIFDLVNQEWRPDFIVFTFIKISFYHLRGRIAVHLSTLRSLQT